MSVHFKFCFWSLSTIILGSKWSTFNSKARFELAKLKTKQVFEKALDGLLFHIGVMDYEYNCNFLKKATRWLDIYFWCSYLFVKVKNWCFVGDDHEVILKSDFFFKLNLWVLQRNEKYDKVTERFSHGYKKNLSWTDMRKIIKQFSRGTYLNSPALLRILSVCRPQVYEWSQLTYIILVAGTCIFKDSEWIKMISNVCALAAFPTSYFTIIWQDKNRDKIYLQRKSLSLSLKKPHT